MDLVIIGDAANVADSEELALAQRQFLAALPAQVPVARVDATTPEALVSQALQVCRERGLRPDAIVLLAKNPYLLPAKGTFDNLANALMQGAAVAYAYSAANYPAGMPPDYMTVRGMERYAACLARGADTTAPDGTPLPALALLKVAALQAGTGSAPAVWVSGAYAHDFSGYHQGARTEVIPFIPDTARRVLDVGGGEGAFLAALKAQRGCEVHLSEYSNAAHSGALKGIDKVWHGDFALVPFDTSFDCITFLDVLEHTEHPQRWLQRAAQLLEPGGCVVASIPNVGHWSVVLDLLEGRWDYAAAGIHCITHLRFFTRHGIEVLMAEAGLTIEHIEPVCINPPAWFDMQAVQGHARIDADSLSSFSYLVRARVAR